MKKTDYEFTFEGFKFIATFSIYPNGVDIESCDMESGIDDELIPITDSKRLTLLTKHLDEKFSEEIESMNDSYTRGEAMESHTFRPGH